MRFSIVIKALNEASKIERTIVSCLAAIEAAGGDGEVILADSLSTDGTVEIASRFPITIVQLTDARDRSCGVGAQLGFQAARGDYIYVLDGDMEMDPAFLPQAFERLERNPRLAGVAGMLEDVVVVNYEAAGRVKRSASQSTHTSVLCLNGGGLYRRKAIEEVGYLTNRNLHAFEEFELGIRLRHAGWQLERLGVRSVWHYGYQDSSYAAFGRRWRSRYAWGHGELVRQALKQSYFADVLRHLRIYHVVALVVAVWSGVLVAGLAAGLGALASVGLALGLWGLIIVAMGLRRRSLGHGLFSVVSWHVAVAGLLGGLLEAPRGRPHDPVSFKVVHSASGSR